jgi:hypothetical protein
MDPIDDDDSEDGYTLLEFYGSRYVEMDVVGYMDNLTFGVSISVDYGICLSLHFGPLTARIFFFPPQGECS